MGSLVAGKIRILSYIRFGAVLLITLLCITLAGCNKEGQGEDEAAAAGETSEEGAAPTETPPPFEFEGTEGSDTGSGSGAGSDTGAGSGTGSSGMTSEELLNQPIGNEQQNTGGMTANIPSNINAVTGNNLPADIPAFNAAQTSSSEQEKPKEEDTSTPVTPATAKGISIKPEEIILYIDKTQASYTGGSATVNATLYNGTGTIVWKSGDTSVALVNGNGNTATVDGIKAGTTTITASISGTDYSATAIVDVRAATPQSFEVDRCLVNKGGEYSAAECDNIIAAVNQARAEYNIPACVKNTGLCKVADVRSKEISYSFMNVRPDGSPYTSVAPEYYRSEGIAVLPKGSSAVAAVNGLKNYTTTRRDLMDENFRNIGASYYTWGNYTYVVVALGY